MKDRSFLYRSWAEIDLGQIVKNYKIYRNAVGDNRRIIAVVKADAYGHGDAEVARALEAEDADFFAVSNINEGKKLRESGVKSNILVLGYTPPTHLAELSKYKIMQTVVDKKHVNELKKYAPNDVLYHLAIDTGMKRIGISCEKNEDLIKEVASAAGALKICGLFTHLSVADSRKEGDIEFTEQAITLFDDVAQESRKFGIEHFHCQNSAGGLLFQSRECNASRLGISLYGYAPSPDVKLPQGVSPALSWKSMVCHVFTVKKGESIGYGRSFVAPRDMKIATVTTGYADGYPRAVSNKGYVLVLGKCAPIVGRICMDMMMVNVSDIVGVNPGDEVTLIGRSGDREITADNIAEWADTISYEILTGISPRVERIYK